MRIENSFIPVAGVGEQTERRLWRAGITHWDAFDGSVVGPTLADRIDRFIAVGRDRLAAGESRFFGSAFPSSAQWRLYEDFRDGACFLDIETTGLDRRTDRVTVVGLHRRGTTRTLVCDQGLSASALAAELADATLLVTFNGAQFDLPFLEASFDLAVDRPHLDLRYPCRRVGLTGGLKAIERTLGIERDRPDLSGRDAVALWRAHRRGDPDALETLLAYNRADTRNLRALADAVTDRLHAAVFAAERRPARTDGD